jgi:hypothetical protein
MAGYRLLNIADPANASSLHSEPMDVTKMRIIENPMFLVG